MKKPRPKTYMKYLALFVLGVSALAARDLKSGYFRGRPVTYEVINGDAVTEGDIVLGTAEEMAVSRPDAGTRAKTVSHEAIDVTTTTRRWPGGVIPYTVDSDVPDKKRITDGIQHWIDNTGLSLVPRTSEANYVRFSRFTGAGDVCGNSQVGMAGRGAQRINLADDCDSSTVIHEIGHAVGLFHEQTRQDRDFYVRVLYNNMDKTQVSQFDQQISAGQDLGSYDYGSVMHYSNFAFSRNGEATLESIPAGIPFRADTG
ncbi:MAG TPA: M12 family metallopeptidase, partial [Bryobacteraceae bacterium]|nr:M12 family metallopeptidase [Bryobacteraceae bacterium]